MQIVHWASQLPSNTVKVPAVTLVYVVTLCFSAFAIVLTLFALGIWSKCIPLLDPSCAPHSPEQVLSSPKKGGLDPGFTFYPGIPGNGSDQAISSAIENLEARFQESCRLVDGAFSVEEEPVSFMTAQCDSGNRECDIRYVTEKGATILTATIRTTNSGSSVNAEASVGLGQYYHTCNDGDCIRLEGSRRSTSERFVFLKEFKAPFLSGGCAGNFFERAFFINMNPAPIYIEQDFSYEKLFQEPLADYAVEEMLVNEYCKKSADESYSEHEFDSFPEVRCGISGSTRHCTVDLLSSDTSERLRTYEMFDNANDIWVSEWNRGDYFTNVRCIANMSCGSYVNVGEDGFVVPERYEGRDYYTLTIPMPSKICALRLTRALRSHFCPENNSAFGSCN